MAERNIPGRMADRYVVGESEGVRNFLVASYINEVRASGLLLNEAIVADFARQGVVLSLGRAPEEREEEPTWRLNLASGGVLQYDGSRGRVTSPYTDEPAYLTRSEREIFVGMMRSAPNPLSKEEVYRLSHQGKEPLLGQATEVKGIVMKLRRKLDRQIGEPSGEVEWAIIKNLRGSGWYIAAAAEGKEKPANNVTG